MKTNFIQSKSKNTKLELSIIPCIEKQELNFCESFKGTPKQLINRSLEIIYGLNKVLKNDDFSIKIQSFDLTKTIYLNSENLFDEDFNIIGKVEDFMNV